MLAVLEAVYKLDARLESQLFTEKILILASFQRFVICACLIFRSVLVRVLLFVFKAAEFSTQHSISDLLKIETALPEIKTALLQIETTLPEIETDLPEIKTAMPEIKTALSQIDIALLRIEIVSED